jgi:hypothetical protein
MKVEESEVEPTVEIKTVWEFLWLLISRYRTSENWENYHSLTIISNLLRSQTMASNPSTAARMIILF